MAIVLDGITLPDLVWDNEFDWSPVSSAAERTIGGGLVVWETPRQTGRPIDLAAAENSGWITRAQVKALKQRADQPGWTGILVYGSEQFRVRFRNEDAPAIDVEPVRPMVDPVDEDVYHGRIKLMEV